MNRIEEMQNIVDEILNDQDDLVVKRCGFVHLYGVSLFATQLAMVRGLDLELCAVAGLLHDIATHRTGNGVNHAERGSVEAREILQRLKNYTEEEIDSVCSAIRHHSDKSEKHGPMEELLKDADTLHHYLCNPLFTFSPEKLPRLEKALSDLNMKYV